MRVAIKSLLVSAVGMMVANAVHAASMSGETVYRERCAVCHDSATDRAPPRAQLNRMSAAYIVTALTKGAMQAPAAGLGTEEIQNVANYLGMQGPATEVAATTRANTCAKTATLDMKASQWNGWGNDLENTRFQAKTGLSASDVSRLKPKWAYAYDGPSANGQSSVVGGVVFVPQVTGRVSALDANTGCEYWRFEAGATVRTAIRVANLRSRPVAFFGTLTAWVFAVDAQTGRELWKVKVDDHAIARVSGATVFHNGVLYVPVSSHEEVSAGDEKYPCCTFRGSVVAMDAATGKILWKGFSIPSAAKPTKVTASGVQRSGPAGGAIWSAPTIDVKRGLIYAATGNSYTDVETEAGSDAIVAFDMKTGKRVWANQVTPKDAFVLGCGRRKAGSGNCPEELGPDFDFGSSPILRTLANGKQIIVAGQKSGMVYGLDPDNKGKLLWETRVGAGSALGGVEWGFSADQVNAYVSVSDIGATATAAKPGVYALDLATGKPLWEVPTPTISCWWTGRCPRGQATASSVIPGVVFAGAFDGHLRAYSTKDGAIIWDFDTSPAIDTVNGGKVEGGSIDATGAVIVDGIVYITSGYGPWGKNGRLLIALSVDGK